MKIIKLSRLVFLMTELLIVILQISMFESAKRSKRYLVFPRGGSSKIVIGIGVPIKLGTKQSMAVGWNLQAQYTLPTNISFLTQYPPDYDRSINKRETHFSDRAMVYAAIESILDGEGYRGRECMLRSICESAVDSFHHEANGLYGQIIHIVFTPTYGDGEIDPDLDPAYLEAQRAGEYGVECDTLFPNCGLSEGFLGLFSVLENQLSYIY